VLALLSLTTPGCMAPERPYDPDGHDHDDAPIAATDLSLAEVVGAAAGVPKGESAAVLERWLSASPEAAELVERWPRDGSGRLDLDRAPVALSAIDASIGPGSKSRCGDVNIVFHGAVGPALRLRLAVPATTPACRGRSRATALHGRSALPLAQAAIADARVPAIAL
jgi:hypothetical protein